MHPLTRNIVAKQFLLADQKCRREIGLTWVYPPTNMHVVALCYLNSRQMAPLALYAYSEFFPDRQGTNNKGTCSDLIAYSSLKFIITMMQGSIAFVVTVFLLV